MIFRSRNRARPDNTGGLVMERDNSYLAGFFDCCEKVGVKPKLPKGYVRPEDDQLDELEYEDGYQDALHAVGRDRGIIV